MKTKNPMQLKALIRNIADEKRISAQLVMQNYMMERLLERISLSSYKKNFIVKGGFLISAIVGLDTRTTMDLDTTVKNFELTHHVIRRVFEEVCTIPVPDDVVFEVVGTSDIREANDYPGIRVSLKANYLPMSISLLVDVTVGDVITPCEIEYTFPLMFDARSISIMAYSVETVLAEKLETVVSRGVANTRPRDYYDIYILWKMHCEEPVSEILKKAIRQTAEKREASSVMRRYDSILSDVLDNSQMQAFWDKYRANYDYAANITFEMAVNTAKEILVAVYDGVDH